MITNPVERSIQRWITERYIAADSEQIVLYRSTKTPNGHGGWTVNPPTQLPPQVAKLIPQASRRQPANQTAQGEATDIGDILLMTYNADVQNGDYFTYAGNQYDVTLVHLKRDYETVVEVTLRGEPG